MDQACAIDASSLNKVIEEFFHVLGEASCVCTYDESLAGAVLLGLVILCKDFLLVQCGMIVSKEGLASMAWVAWEIDRVSASPASFVAMECNDRCLYGVSYIPYLSGKDSCSHNKRLGEIGW